MLWCISKIHENIIDVVDGLVAEMVESFQNAVRDRIYDAAYIGEKPSSSLYPFWEKQKNALSLWYI